MFRHEAAPLCQNLGKCKFKKCQFSHNNNNDNEENVSDINEEVDDEVTNDNDACVISVYCNELVDHSEHNLQECSKCDLTSKVWAEYNKYWNITHDHIFSTKGL